MNPLDHSAYPDSYIRGILNTVKTIAMVGFSPKENRPSYFAFKYLIERGYRVIPVNPGHAGKEVRGQKVYASLADIPEPVDMVDIFRGAPRSSTAGSPPRFPGSASTRARSHPSGRRVMARVCNAWRWSGRRAANRTASDAAPEATTFPTRTRVGGCAISDSEAVLTAARVPLLECRRAAQGAALVGEFHG
jgi:hypothetical protein